MSDEAEEQDDMIADDVDMAEAEADLQEAIVVGRMTQIIAAIRGLYLPGVKLTIAIRKPDDADGHVWTDESSPMDVEHLIQMLRKFNGH